MNTKQLRQKILDLAIKGLLVPQDPNDEPASKLLERIREEKEKLIQEGKLKRDKNESYIFTGDDKLYYEKFADGSIVCIEDEIPFEIPKTWAWCRLKDIASNKVNAFVDGPFGSDLKVEHYTEKREVRLIQLNNVGDGFWKDEVKKYTTFSHAKNLLRCKTVLGDIVIAKMMPAGRCIIVPSIEKQYIISSDCVKLSAHNDINKNYITNMINSPTIRKTIQEDTQGIGRSRTSLGKLKELLIPLSPINEQKRISETVETLLKLVDSIDSNKIELSALINQTKSKVLDLAIRGKLVEQNPNDEPADKLLEKIREEKEKLIKEGKLKRDKNETYIFKNSDDNSYYEQIGGETVYIDDDLPFEIPDSWRWCRMQNCIDVRDGTHDTPEYVNKGIPLITSKNLSSGYLNFSQVQYISKEDHISISARSKVDNGDILFAMIGSIGNPVIVDTNIEFSIKNVALFKNLKLKQMYMQFVYRYLSLIQNDLRTNAKGGNQPFVSLALLRNILIPIPPYKEQLRIAEKTKEIFLYLDNLEKIIKGS